VIATTVAHLRGEFIAAEAGTDVAVPASVVSTTDDRALGPSAGAEVLDPRFSPESIVFGRTSRMRAIFDFLNVVADSESNVVIIGETGTGKELIARFIHHHSPRRQRPFVSVSCAILTESLIESELFGHERGAFTGAVQDHPGRFEMADRGTIFLDDIDDVPPAVQLKLLRVIQQRTIERVGGIREIPVDVRIITAAKRSLRRMVADGTFRQDLFYRLNVLPIWLPPLRERRDDIPILTDHFMTRFFQAAGRQPPVLSATVRDLFQRYPWPGNVRELENACERIAQTCTCREVRCACMPSTILFQRRDALPAPSPDEAPDLNVQVSLDDRLAEVEGQFIAWALTASHGNRSKAAELLQVKRSTLGDRIRKLGLDSVGKSAAHETRAGDAL
jgi:transcriptional regulator with GAF, ATPase, and Fis domain